MRLNRRGNYAILFVLTAAVMLSYLAFSIDGGRVKVASIQAENAAEAAALTAIAAWRDGSSKSVAQALAESAANAVTVTKLKNEDEVQFNVDVTWGEWDWNEAVDNIDDRWASVPSAGQAITINVEMANGGVTSIFGPAINIVSQGDWEESDLTSDRSGKREGPTDFSSFDVKYGARAAMRHRDIVVLFDASHTQTAFMTESTTMLNTRMGNIQAGLTAFVNRLEELGVPGDRVALVAYAGGTYQYDVTNSDALEVFDLYGNPTALPSPTLFNSIEDDFQGLSDTVTRLSPCRASSNRSWFHHYRHASEDLALRDNELRDFDDNYFGFNYRWISLNGGGQPIYSFDHADPKYWPTIEFVGHTMNSMLDLGLENNEVLDHFKTMAENEEVLDDDYQCATWSALELWYNLYDVRGLAAVGGGHPSPLECSDGHFYTGEIRPQDEESKLPSVVCPALPELYPGQPRYGSADGSPFVYAQYDAPQAGSNPGVALNYAADLLEATDSTAEPTVVLIAGIGAQCGPSVALGELADCNAAFEAEAAAGWNRLDALDATVHVLAPDLSAVGSGADLGTLYARGRGFDEIVATDFGDLPAVLVEDVAQSVKIQVVK